MINHIEPFPFNEVIHITQEEREFWNGKVSCFIDPTNNQNLIFTVN